MAIDHNFRIKNGLEVGGQEVISSSGVVTSAALGGQTLSSTDSPTFDNLTLTGSLRGPATMTIDPAAVGDNTGTLVIAGNLQVDGTTTTINSTTMEVDDLNITLASGSANSAAANGAGITVDIANNTNATLLYNGSIDRWDFNKALDVTGYIQTDTAFRAYDSDNTAYRNVLRYDSGDVRLETGTGGSANLGIWTGGGRRINVLSSNGYVGINKDTPLAQLHVYSTPAEGFRLEGNDEYVYNSYYGTVSSTLTRLGYIGFANQTGTATDFNFVNDQSGNFTFDTLSATRLEISASMINANTDVTITTANEPHLRLNKSTAGGQTAILLREQGTTRTQLTSNFSDDKFYLYHGGVNALTLDGTGQARFTGAFEVGSGVGNTRSTIDTNGTYFHYYDAETSPRIQLGRDIGISGGAGVGFGGNGAYALIGTNDTSGTNLYFKTNATVATVTSDPDMTILSTGKVGISNSSPNYLLEVGSATQTESNIFSGRVNGDFIFNLSKANTNLYSIRNNGNSVVHVNTQNSARLALGVSSGTGTGTIVEYLTITADGNVGINKSSGFTAGGFAAGLGPNLVMKQRVNSQWGGINIEAEGNDSVFAIGSSNDAHYIGASYRTDAGYKPLKFIIAGGERMNITTGGNVCIGTNNTSPTNADTILDVQGGDIQVRDTVGGNVGGRIYSMDHNHSIYFREGALNRTNYYQYGGTRAQGLGHRFFTGGALANQSMKFQIADDDVFVDGPSFTVKRNSGNIRIESQSDSSNYYATFNSNYSYGQAFDIKVRGAGSEATILKWADGNGVELNSGYATTKAKVVGDVEIVQTDKTHTLYHNGGTDIGYKFNLGFIRGGSGSYNHIKTNLPSTGNKMMKFEYDGWTYSGTNYHESVTFYTYSGQPGSPYNLSYADWGTGGGIANVYYSSDNYVVIVIEAHVSYTGGFLYAQCGRGHYVTDIQILATGSNSTTSGVF